MEVTVDSGYYAACAGLVAKMQALDLAANNLANVSTTGFRGQNASFQSVMAGVRERAANGTQLINEFGVLNAPSLNLTQGNLESTGNPLDVAIAGPGFFAVQTADGERYTRNGSFRVSASGQLLSATGDPVLGEQGPIQLENGAVTISGDGTISINGALAGKLRVVEFPRATPLTGAGASYYSAPQAAATAATQSTLQQGKLESSNVNPVAGAVELISIQRNAEMLQRALATFHTQFNQLAAQELPKV
jgi:flagellar basal-body rod protein FlgF/flagellar basal-body rod protein FlgG